MIIKRKCLNILTAAAAAMLFLLLVSCSGGKWVLPDDYQGQWESGPEAITIRTSKFPMRFSFLSDTAIITMQFHEDQTASGSIGDASFANARIRKNKGNPVTTGVAFIIECGEIGKIFPEDPLAEKKVELWVGPMKESGFFNAELRYTSGLSQFPMAGMMMKKVQP
jgi:hypothetical protein